MPLYAPFTLGPFTVQPDGRLSHVPEEATPCFSFRWRGHLMRAVLPDGDSLTLRTVLGRVPSTADRRQGSRQQSFLLMRAFAGMSSENWKVSLQPDHQVVLTATVQLPQPVTATALLTAITAFLLSVSPYLDLVDESGMPPKA